MGCAHLPDQTIGGCRPNGRVREDDRVASRAEALGTDRPELLESAMAAIRDASDVLALLLVAALAASAFLTLLLVAILVVALLPVLVFALLVAAVTVLVHGVAPFRLPMETDQGLASVPINMAVDTRTAGRTRVRARVGDRPMDMTAAVRRRPTSACVHPRRWNSIPT